MRKTTFYIDGLGEFKGYTDGSNWKGWETPYFSLEESKKIIVAYNLDELNEEKAYYNKEKDCFMIWDGGLENYESVEKEIIQHKGIAIEVYPLGASSWIWGEEK